MYPVKRQLSNSVVSFGTAVLAHLFAAKFYGADDRFTSKVENRLSNRCLSFRNLEIGLQI